MKKSSWMIVPAAFFFLFNFSISSYKTLFFLRLIYFLFLVFLFFFLRRFDLKKILIPIVGGVSLILFIYGILQKLILFPYYLRNLGNGNNFYSQAFKTRLETGRVFSLFTLPSLYAIICAVLILFIFHYFLKSQKNKIYWVLLLILGMINIVLTQSFGGILYLSIGVLIYLFLSGILNFKNLAPVIMAVFLFFFIITGLRYSEAKELEPIKLRFSNWQQAYRTIKSSPILGIGLGNYESKISYFTLPGEAKSIYAHNFFLQFISELGVIIFLFILLILFLSIKKLKPENSKEKVLYISAFIIMLVYNLIDIGFYFFSAGIITVVIVSQIYEKKNEKYCLNLSILVILSIFLMVQTFSGNYQKKANFLLSQKNFEEAEIYYKKSLKINPFNFKSLTGLGNINFIKNNYLESEKYLNESLKLYPDSAFANYLKSKVDFKKEHFLNSLYHASLAFNKNRLNYEYKRWYEFIKNNIQIELSKTGI
jgi:O-antigen ligase